MSEETFAARIKNFYSKHHRFINGVLLLAGLYLGLAMAGLFYKPLSPQVLLSKENADAAKQYMLGFGWLAPFIFILLQVAQVVIVPIPGQVVGFIAGFIFGWKQGTLLAMTGMTIGMFIVFNLSRRLGRGFVERREGGAALQEFEQMFFKRGQEGPGLYERSKQSLGSHALLTFFLIMLLPGFPDNLACFVVGLTRIPIRKLMLAAVVGRFPSALVLALFGDGWSQSEANTTVLAITAITLALTGLYLWQRQRIEAWLRRYAGREG